MERKRSGVYVGNVVSGSRWRVGGRESQGGFYTNSGVINESWIYIYTKRASKFCWWVASRSFLGGLFFYDHYDRWDSVFGILLIAFHGAVRYFVDSSITVVTPIALTIYPVTWFHGKKNITKRDNEVGVVNPRGNPGRLLIRKRHKSEGLKENIASKRVPDVQTILPTSSLSLFSKAR